jgi:hypothetical protein
MQQSARTLRRVSGGKTPGGALGEWEDEVVEGAGVGESADGFGEDDQEDEEAVVVEREVGKGVDVDGRVVQRGEEFEAGVEAGRRVFDRDFVTRAQVRAMERRSSRVVEKERSSREFRGCGERSGASSRQGRSVTSGGEGFQDVELEDEDEKLAKEFEHLDIRPKRR